MIEFATGTIISLILAIPTLVHYRRRIRHFFVSKFGKLETIRAELLKLSAKETIAFEEVQNVSTFREGKVAVKNYVDLMSASCCPQIRRKLGGWMVRFVKSNDLSFTRVAVPKLGNVLLADVISEIMEIPLVIARQEDHHHIADGKKYDGQMLDTDRVILVDDIASDAEFLDKALDAIGSSKVAAIVTLINRKEGNCDEVFKAKGVPFMPLINLEDADLK